MRMNKIFVIFGVSGSGQDTVIEGVIVKGLKAVRVITTATRKMRPGERLGQPYYFISKKKFRGMILANRFIEWDLHYGDYYGCTYHEFERARKTGKIILWKTDIKGALTIKRKFPEAITIYIKPPSLQVTLARIRNRKTDSAEIIKKRLVDIKAYLKSENDGKFDYVLVNYDGRLRETVDKVATIIRKNII
ncbi:hypothetical protein COV56_01260 [Candidatus Kuenenbacteria bacterium CG11_big_fil_rev_8_21_14_0_20_37_9]|nr:MAG: hypothetical protein COV56_01260 [Candidatus Kuenenbacteria bacterium CG11_big_fil_rev_8_21_14_0_20_37_9]